MNASRPPHRTFRLTVVALTATLAATAAAAPAGENWTRLCTRCHGASGDGRTAIGAKLKIKDYTDPRTQEAFTDAGLLKNLLLGVASSDDTERMPAYKEKLSVAEARELVALIRTFKR